MTQPDVLQEPAASSSAQAAPFVRVQNLSVTFPLGAGLFGRAKRFLTAVDNVSLTIAKGSTLALVGESGSGKTTTGRAMAGLIPRSAGEVEIGGVQLAPKTLPAIRRKAQMVFQDPFSSLDPRMRVGPAVLEPIRIMKTLDAEAGRRRVAELLDLVGLSPQAVDRYPGEFSGGQRQRIAIARALAPGPEFLICDEPTSALDVSVQAQIVNLFTQLKEELGLTYLLISHDLALVRQLADFVAVMYLGRVVEYAHRDLLYRSPVHPYTQALLSAIPGEKPSGWGQNTTINSVAAVREVAAAHRQADGRGGLEVRGETDSVSRPVSGQFDSADSALERSGLVQIAPQHWVAEHSWDLAAPEAPLDGGDDG